MLSPLLFCRTERDLNGEEDDYLPDLEGEQTIHCDRLNVPQGTQCNALPVTFRPTKQDVIKKVHFVAFWTSLSFYGYVSVPSTILETYVPVPAAPVSVSPKYISRRNLIHQSKTAHHRKELLTHHGKTPIDRMLQKKTFKNTFDDNYEILDDFWFSG